ncbi:hypothetical protein ACFVW8_31785 [Streptomyces sp. NPDC058221]|uniref:hypothetical protein n=1 Tax=Streptomyces sp. NPDC058221 TaxID=3346388 RepID=UPI0036E5A04C
MGDLQISTTHQGPQGTVTVVDGDTGAVLGRYNYSDRSLAISSTMPPDLIKAVMKLIFTYLSEMERAQQIRNGGDGH